MRSACLVVLVPLALAACGDRERIIVTDPPAAAADTSTVVVPDDDTAIVDPSDDEVITAPRTGDPAVIIDPD